MQLTWPGKGVDAAAGRPRTQRRRAAGGAAPEKANPAGRDTGGARRRATARGAGEGQAKANHSKNRGPARRRQSRRPRRRQRPPAKTTQTPLGARRANADACRHPPTRAWPPARPVAAQTICPRHRRPPASRLTDARPGRDRRGPPAHPPAPARSPARAACPPRRRPPARAGETAARPARGAPDAGAARTHGRARSRTGTPLPAQHVATVALGTQQLDRARTKSGMRTKTHSGRRGGEDRGHRHDGRILEPRENLL